jgi:hypothetical protein
VMGDRRCGNSDMDASLAATMTKPAAAVTRNAASKDDDLCRVQ